MGSDDGGKVVTIKPAYVFDVTQTQERTQRAAAWTIRAGRERSRPARLSPDTTHGEPPL